MTPCPKNDLVSQKRQKLINDLQELIDCMQLGPSAPVAAKTGSTGSRKKIVCLPCPDGDRNRGNYDGDGSRPKPRVRDTELKGGVMISGCQCIKRNGLQHDCPRSECMGRPPCLVKPWPDCLPSGGTGLKGGEPRTSKYPNRPATCPMPDMPPGYQEDPCHRAEVDCKKCRPVLMCRPGEDAGSFNPDNMRMNVIGQLTTCTKFVRDTDDPPQQQCRPANPQPIQQTDASECGGIRHCDPPTHVMKQTAYAVESEVPRCPKPKMIHHPGGKELPNYVQVRAGIVLTRCDCVRYNGLQDECLLKECGIPECLQLPPDCLPAGGRGARHRQPACDKAQGDALAEKSECLICPPGYEPYICHG